MSNAQRAELVSAACKLVDGALRSSSQANRHARRCRVAVAVHEGETNIERLVAGALA